MFNCYNADSFFELSQSDDSASDQVVKYCGYKLTIFCIM
jgi:hypothetical protein